MKTIEHILFPIDFSDRISGALPFVDQMATKFGAKLTLLNVAQPYWYGVGAPGGATAPVMVNSEEITNVVKERLANTWTQELAHLTVDRVVEIGDPATVITEFAQEHGVGLIMMPTHGYGPFRELLLGSVASKVLHDAHCPVWTATHLEEGPSVEHIKPSKILCAVDTTPKTIDLLRWASDFAKAAGADFRLIHVLPHMEGYATWTSPQMEIEIDNEMESEARKEIGKLTTEAAVDAPLRVVLGPVANALKEEAQREQTDLLIIGRGVMQKTLGRLLTHAYSVIRQAPCPVISV
jgi:nucleotide-binding universal stress UspA family protein